MTDPEDFLLSSYDYCLPPAQIAQFPSPTRGSSRLMLLPENGAIRHGQFADLPDLLPPNSLLVANNSRVIPARLSGRRKSGGKAEVFLLTPLPLLTATKRDSNIFSAPCEVLIRPAAKIAEGDTISITPQLSCRIAHKHDFGKCDAELVWTGDLEQILESAGTLPLPPYIRRPVDKADASRYQTIYASRSGSIAAPTAGLHFTEDLRHKLRNAGHDWTEISLHVGYGTFSPVRTPDIREHKMHGEYVQMDAETAHLLREAREKGRPIVAVGTTSLRALEGIFHSCGNLREFSGMVDIFLYPGKRTQVATGLITNFHLPGSTLLMLVASLVGRKRILDAYQVAVREGYRFFSYGDAMLIR